VSPSARQLTETVSWVRDHLWKRTAVAVALWVAAGVALVLSMAWLAVGAEGWRPGSNVPAVFDGLIVAWVVAGIAVLRAGARRWFGEVPLAGAIERAVGLGAGIVRGSLELARQVPAGVSDSLATHAVARTASGLSGRAAEDLAGDLGRRVAAWTRRGMIALAVSTVVLVALGVAGPERAAKAWAGVSSPLSTMRRPALEPLSVRPGSIQVMRGTDVRVDIDAPGRLGVDLAWQEAGQVSRSRRLDVVGGRSSYVFEAVSAATEYSVRSDDGFHTETYRIVPIDPLFVSDLVVGVEYPSYTGVASDEYRGAPPLLRLPVGSKLTFQGLASRPLSEVGLVDSVGAKGVDLEVNGPSFTGTWTPRLDGVFKWVFRDETGAPAEIAPDPLEIVLVPDSLPTARILSPGQDTVLPLSLREPLVIDARDDYGLTRFELVAYKVTSLGQRQEPVVQGLDMGGTRGALARPTLDVSTWDLLPGDTVHYFARVVDNNPSRQVGVSREYVLRMPAARELQREAQATLETVANQLAALRDSVARQAETNRDQALEDAGRQSQATPGTSDRDQASQKREEVQKALADQATILDRVDSLKTALESLQQTMEDAGQSTPELTDQLQQLQDLLNQLGAGDLDQRMKQLSDAVQNQSTQQNTQSLQDLARDQDALRQQIDDAVQRVQQAAAQQDFRATTDEAKDLARRQQALADAMKEPDDPSLRANQQADLADKAEQLESRMKDLAERLSEVQQQQTSAAVDQARQQAAQAQQQMRQAEQRASQRDNQNAAAQAQQAADQMQQAAQQMQDAQGQQAQQTQQSAQDAFQQTVDDALSLARRQAALQQRMQGAGQDELSGMRGDQASLMRGLQNMQQNLESGTQSTGGNQSVSQQMQQALQAMQNTADALGSSRSSSASQQAQQAVNALNQLAMSAISAGSEQQSGSANPGQGGQDMAQQVGQLAQRQGQLVTQTDQLAPMRLGQHALQQQLNQLATQQASVAKDLQHVSQEPGAGNALGNLEALAQQADDLAQQMDQGRLTPDVMRQQQELFHRLLDAGRTLERKDDYSNERESKTAGAFVRGDVLPLSDAQLGLTRYAVPNGQQMQQLSPAVRQLVIEYFDRLNQAGSAPEGTR
jgi:hypothetical protein